MVLLKRIKRMVNVSSMKNSLAVSLLLLSSTAYGFVTTKSGSFSLSSNRNHDYQNQHGSLSSSSSALYMKNLIVISPPGGVGEVTSVEAAKNGNAVKWFVVSPKSSSSIKLAANTLQEIETAGGSVQLAGASIEDLLNGEAVSAVSAWCGAADGMVCTYDSPSSSEEEENDWKNAIKIAAREASSKNSIGVKLAILSSNEENLLENEDDETEEGGGGLLSNLFNSKAVDIPSTLSAAMGSTKVTTLRYGTLFGTPPSVRISQHYLFWKHLFCYFICRFKMQMYETKFLSNKNPHDPNYRVL